MRRVGNLWPQVSAFANLLEAWRKARRGKARQNAVADFGLDLEANLFSLQRALDEGYWRPGAYRQFTIYDRKPRIISAAPFPDRVVHHALMNVVAPVLDARLASTCFACRPGKGVHAALRFYQHQARRYAYCLKMDVRQYFPSIDRERLKEKLGRILKDARVLSLFDVIIDSPPDNPHVPVLFPGDDLVTGMLRQRGLPIGNLTSQLLGNLYLADVDRAVLQSGKPVAYMRYVDDIIVLGDSKQLLWDLRDEVAGLVQSERLRLHEDKCQVRPVARGVDVLGYRVFPHHVRLRADAGIRYRRRLRGLARGFKRGNVELPEVRESVMAWLGHCRHANSTALCNAVLGSVKFQRGSGREPSPSGAAGRLLEQQRQERPLG